MNPPHRFFLLLVPIAWMMLSAISFRYPGDEYGLWGFSSIAGTWAILVAPSFFSTLSGDHPRDLLPWVLAVGFFSTAIPAYLLDRFRAPRIPFLIVWATATFLLTINAIGQHESYQRAMSKNGSLQAYIYASSVITLTGTALLFVLIAAALTIWRQNRAIP
jgi:hypothetical protein